MKRDYIIAMLCGIFLSLTLTVSAQGNKVSLKCNGLSLATALYKVEQQSGYYKINYNYTELNAHNVSADIRRATTLEAVNQLLAGLPYTATVSGKFIQINRSAKVRQQTSGQRTVRGQLLEQNGEPLVGATVRVEGTDKGTVTDANGRYEIMDVAAGDVLEYSYVGMKTYRRKATQPSVSIVMENDDNTFDDVVVTGYQTLKRENATGSFQKITSKDMDQRYTGDISTNLEGKVPGLIQYNNGITNQLTIRGAGSLSASTQPLVVVNGLPISGDINSINPYEIESITVLKDAAAAAIYGARASNGVIVVVTKKAVKDKLEIDFNADLTIQNKYNYDNMGWMNAAEELELNEYNFDYIKSNASAFQSFQDSYSKYPYHWSPMVQLMMEHYLGKVSDADYQTQKDAWSKNDFRKEWQDLMERQKVTQQYNLSLRSKGKYLNSSISVNYKGNNQGSPDLYEHTFSANYQGLLDVTKWMNLRFGIYVQSDRSKDRLSKFNLKSMTSYQEYESMWNADGTPAALKGAIDTREVAALGNDELKSEEYVLQDDYKMNYSKTRSTLIRPFIHLNVQPVDGLNLSAQFQYEDIYSKSEGYYKSDSYDMRHLYNLYTYKGTHYMPDGGLLDVSTDEGAHFTFRTQANYDKTFLDKHAVEALVGFEYRQTKTRSTYDEQVGYDDQTQTNSTQLTNLYDAYKLNHSDLGESFSPVGYRIGANSSSDVLHRFYSIYSTLGYTYDHRYSISGSYRVDKADLFGADPKFRGRPLWSVGMSWNLHNEDFMKDIKWLNMFKLRASYGLTGNINSSVSSYLTARIRTEYIYGGKRATLNTPPNDQLRWEKTKTWNFGFDYAMFDNRLRGSFDFYRKLGSDILSTTDLDPTTGWSSLTINNAEIRNQGIELQIDADILRARSRSQIGVNASFNLAVNSNKVTSVNHEATSGYEALESDTYHVGKPVHSLYSMRYGGIALDENGDQQVYFIKADGTKCAAATFDDEFEAQDAVFSGSLDPKVSMSLTPTITWQGFSLSALMVFYGGHYMRMNADEWTIVQGFEYSGALSKSLLNYWRSDDKTAYLANGYAAHNMRMYDDDPVQMDINVEHADYMKMRSLVLGYEFDRDICKRLHLQGLRLRVQMNNVFTWARNSRSLDPEAVNPYTGANLVKTPKSYVMSLGINF